MCLCLLFLVYVGQFITFHYCYSTFFFFFSTAGLYLDFLVIFHPQFEQVSFMYQRVDVVTVPSAGARSTLQREDVTERLNNCYQQASLNIFSSFIIYTLKREFKNTTWQHYIQNMLFGACI